MFDYFENELIEKTSYVDKVITNYLPEEKGYSSKLFSAINYSVLAGGKRIRPLLLMESYCLFSNTDYKELPEYVKYFMAAIEYIHTYSLVHDDLPAMDNDEYRRGKLTTWKVYGDAMGILAGDGLLNAAFELIFKSSSLAIKNNDLTMAHRLIKAGEVLGNKAGCFGMIGGQCVDLEAEGKGSDVSSEELLFIHKHKTACLLEAPLMIGAILAGASDEEIALMEECGTNVGIAFQIQDDILDVCGTTEELGKAIGSDAANEKVTYVSLNGLEKSREDVNRMCNSAEEILVSLKGDHKFLDRLVMSLANRRK